MIAEIALVGAVVAGIYEYKNNASVKARVAALEAKVVPVAKAEVAKAETEVAKVEADVKAAVAKL